MASFVPINISKDSEFSPKAFYGIGSGSQSRSEVVKSNDNSPMPLTEHNATVDTHVNVSGIVNSDNASNDGLNVDEKEMQTFLEKYSDRLLAMVSDKVQAQIATKHSSS